METQNAELVLKYRELEVEQQKFENYQVDYKHQNDDLRRQIESENAARVRLAIFIIKHFLFKNV